MEIKSEMYYGIYMPLVEQYIKRYFEKSSLAQNNYIPENLTIPCTDDIKQYVNKAYQEGLYEGLNNGFIEGFMQCIEHYANLEPIQHNNNCDNFDKIKYIM